MDISYCWGSTESYNQYKGVEMVDVAYTLGRADLTSTSLLKAPSPSIEGYSPCSPPESRAEKSAGAFLDPKLQAKNLP